MVAAGLTFGWLVFGWVGLGLVALVAVVFVLETIFDDGYWGHVGSGLLAVLTVLFGLGVAITAIVLPDENKVNYEYTGVVEEVTNTFESGTGDFTGGAFTFRVEGIDEVLYTRSTRIQAMEGEEVNLLCTRVWEPRAADYWDCKIGNGN